MIKLLKVMHVVGLLLVIAGVLLLLFTDIEQQVQGMLITASLIAVGLLAMSPFPIALFFEWAKKQDAQQTKD